LNFIPIAPPLFTKNRHDAASVTVTATSLPSVQAFC
jgi:hypothetical protein